MPTCTLLQAYIVPDEWQPTDHEQQGRGSQCPRVVSVTPELRGRSRNPLHGERQDVENEEHQEAQEFQEDAKGEHQETMQDPDE